MDIRSTQLKRALTPAHPQAGTPQESSTFGMNFDPFGGIKTAARDVVELGGNFAMGAVPGLGMHTHAEIALVGGFSGRGQGDTTLAVGGGVANLVGTGALLVAGGQALFGGDPSIALGVSAAALAGSGIASSMLLR